jgi:hypothetical protein
MRRVRFALRLLGRGVVVAIVGAFITVVGLQYARIIGRNVDMADRLTAAQNDIRTLQVKRAEQDRQIRRLSDPAGAIPEIHDKLHLVGDHEAIIYLKKHGGGP